MHEELKMAIKRVVIS